MIISDPTNKFIDRIYGSGGIKDGIIKMYNGVSVYKNSYYGNFSDILILNEAVHEPSEEWVFNELIKKYVGKNPVMIELGSYWSFYSMALKKICENATTYCVEAGIEEMDWGKKNFELNGMKGVFQNSFIGFNGVSLVDIFNKYDLSEIDILHCDIQGFEEQMLIGAKQIFENKKIDYVFLSTHSMILHNTCRAILNNYGYKIIADVDINNTFCEDGILIACSPNINSQYFSLPKRTENTIISDEQINLLFSEKINKAW